MKTKNEYARQAIVTQYKGATDFKGARIIVKTCRGRKSYPYPHNLSDHDCHVWAADQYLKAIAEEDRKEYGSPLGWGDIHDFSVGVLPSGEHVFVLNN
jgi:hypothetical protein